MHAMIDRDREHLRLLSIFHYVYGGMVGLFSCFPILHVTVGIALASGAIPVPKNQPQIPAFAGWIFIVAGSLFIIVGWTIAGLTIYAGRCLARRKNYILCLIVAGLECLFVPQGSVLGVCTLLVLLRPSVKPLFESDGSTA